MPVPPPEGFTVPGVEADPSAQAPADPIWGWLGGPSLADVWRVVVVFVGTLALAGLGAVMILAGLLALLGFGPGDVAKLTPPGRAGTLAEVAVSRKG